MTRIVMPFALLATMVALALPAHAQSGSLTRSFVSSAGVDTNACMIAAPCATFAQAYTKIGPNGIITALDPGKYGPITITTGVTINGNGWAAITAPAGGNGITINSGSGNVLLLGLEIDGAGSGYNGIVDNSAGSLTVTSCTLQNFINNGGTTATGNGILLQPASGTPIVTISDTTVAFSTIGITYFPPAGSTAAAVGTIDSVIATGNQSDGIHIDASAVTSGNKTGVTITSTLATNNGGSGIYANAVSAGGTLVVSIDNVTTATNNISGIDAEGTANVLLGRSVITANFTGLTNNTSPDTFFTYKDNRINLNGGGGDGASTLQNTTFGQQ